MINLAGHEFDERGLIQRFMLNMRGISRHGDPRWVLVKDAFGVGSTVAHAMCREFEVNPDEILRKGKP